MNSWHRRPNMLPVMWALSAWVSLSHVGASEDARKVELVMTPLSRQARPGGVVVCELVLSNRGENEVTVADPQLNFFLDGQVSWTWVVGDVSESVLLPYDGIPCHDRVSLVTIAGGNAIRWFPVVPVSEKLQGHDSAALVAGFYEDGWRDGSDGSFPGFGVRRIAEARADIRVGSRFQWPESPHVNVDWFLVATATGPSFQSFNELQTRAEREPRSQLLTRWKTETDPAMLLAWFCASLPARDDGFDRRAWEILQRGPEDLRLVRNAHLFRAIDAFGKKLEPDVLEMVSHDVQGTDALSSAIRERIKAISEADK
jgi:hypothetical protein